MPRSLMILSGAMATRALLIWFVLLFVAVANGAFREAVLVPRIGAPGAHAISTLILSALIVILGWLTVPWIAPESLQEAWGIGAAWLLLTLTFEFLAGHYLFGKPWSVLLADYNVLAGRIWVLVLVVTTLAPVLTFLQRAIGRVSH